MKKYLQFLIITILISTQLTSQSKNEKLKLNTKKEKLSYTIGVDIGKNIKQQNLDVDLKIINEGIKNILDGLKLQLTEEEMNEVMKSFQQEIVEAEQKKESELKSKNLEDGNEFLAKNALKEGVVVLPSGLQYKIIVDGKGKKPQSTDTIFAHHKGTLIDGTIFDSSLDKGVPIEYPVDKFIKGWTEALQLMQEGSKWQLFVPAHLAYGERTKSSIIGPNSTLIFEMELIKIK
ncbi:MAG: FKBP-type peptidyl-prolyl cis-trans isomerase [Bacteroidetes bacterium]|nr:FKBP-type peptidyl-prolyl cis-trans isomerase [Bacteroidota bacterium]